MRARLMTVMRPRGDEGWREKEEEEQANLAFGIEEGAASVVGLV
jgi:hypothetical protein